MSVTIFLSSENMNCTFLRLFYISFHGKSNFPEVTVHICEALNYDWCPNTNAFRWWWWRKKEYWRSCGVSHVGISGDSLYRFSGCFLLCGRWFTFKDKDSARNADAAYGSNCAAGCVDKDLTLPRWWLTLLWSGSTRRQ